MVEKKGSGQINVVGSPQWMKMIELMIVAKKRIPETVLATYQTLKSGQGKTGQKKP
jgi:hypothetical protein